MKKTYDDFDVLDLNDSPNYYEDKASIKKEKKKKKRSNREFAVATYGILILLIAVCVHFAYYLFVESEDFISSSYNRRLGKLSENVVRGNIYSSDGVLLATSNVYEDGSEERVYPEGRKYAHAVGYVSNGMAGVEKDQNFYLLRSHSFILNRIKNEIRGRKNQGDSLITSLDSKLQNTAYNKMGSYNGAVIAIEPETGKILSMVSKGDFDPNEIAYNWDSLTNDGSSSVLVNRATQGLYPPGSVFKIISALEYEKEGGSKDDMYNCEGEYTSGGYTIHDYHNVTHGQSSFKTAFANSCNSIFAKIGTEIKADKLTALSESLLFNKKLSTALSNTNKSKFELSNNSPEALKMQTFIGQGNTVVTPLHMAMLVSAIANDGELMRPYIADSIVNDNNKHVRSFRSRSLGKILSIEDASLLSDYMRAVVTDGTARALSGADYTAYGKTGTAEYNSNKDAHSWFVGFAQKDGKKIAVAVILEGAGAGSEHALPLAKEMFDVYYH